MQLKLVLDVEYTPNGVSTQVLVDRLGLMVHEAMGTGVLLQGAATIDSWDSKVEIVDDSDVSEK